MNRLIITVVFLAIPALATTSHPRSVLSYPSPVTTWGFANHSEVADSPMGVSGIPDNVTDVQAGNWGGLAIAGDDRAVWQWDASSHPRPTEIGPENNVAIGEGYYFSASVTTSGNVWTWGRDNSGALCIGKKTDNAPPTEVRGITDAIDVSGGADHLMILTSDGHVESCGQNTFGELGDGSFQSSDTPVRASGLDDVTAISSGDTFSVALTASGDVYEWGYNNWGQLGDGTTTDSNVPVEVVGLPGPVAQIYAGGSRSDNGQVIALLRDGSVYAWGNDEWGQLGNGEAEAYSATPVQVDVPNGTTFKSVATGGASSYAIDSSGHLWAWGNDNHGYLGNGKNSGYAVNPEEIGPGYSQLSAVAGIAVAYQ
jgi:alpha-tubulin suppressor-like RCC1 family protein